MFNTQQPSLDPTQFNNQTPQWAQIVNLHPTEWKLFNIRLYDLVGNLILDEPVSIPPLGRRDKQAGHENPGQQQLGLVEIRPRDQSSPYLAQVFRYAADAPAFVFTDRFSFATGVTSLRGIPFTINAPVSNGAGAITWAAVANVSDTAGTVEVNVIENGGTTVFSTQIEVEARGQRHFNIDSVLPTGASGVIRFTPRDNLRIISETVSYFIGDDGRVSGAGVSPGRFIYAGDYHVPYNSFLGQLNWIRLQNTFNREAIVTIEVYDEDGNSLGSTSVTLGAKEGRDVELALSLGLPVDPDNYGLVRISSNITAAVFTTLYRVKLDEVVDLAKPLPGR